MATLNYYNVKDDMIDSEWEKHYRINCDYWGKIKNSEVELNETLIQEMINNKVMFYIIELYDDLWKRPEELMIKISFFFIGTNIFYGYVSKDFYNNVLKNYICGEI